MHFCYSHRDVFLGMLGGRWQLNRIVYVIPPDVSAEIEENLLALEQRLPALRLGTVPYLGPAATPEQVNTWLDGTTLFGQ